MHAAIELLENVRVHLRNNTTFLIKTYVLYITDLARLYQLVCYTVLIEAVGRHFLPKSNDDNLPCFLYLSFFYALNPCPRICVLDPGAVPGGQVPGGLPPDSLREHPQTRHQSHQPSGQIS